MKRFFGVAVAALVLVSAVSAYSAQDIVGSAHFETLKKEGKIQDNKFKGANTAYTLMPSTELSRKIVSSGKNDIAEPSLVGENLYLIPRDKISINRASEILRSISKMQGMKYYSHGKGKWMELYRDAYCISGPESTTKVADRTSGSANGQVQYCLLNDNSLGKTNYKVVYSQTENEIAMSLVNTTPVSFGPIKAVKPDNLQINLVLTLCDDYAVVYMTVKSKFLSVGVLETRMQNSLTARLTAIYDWFLMELKA